MMAPLAMALIVVVLLVVHDHSLGSPPSVVYVSAPAVGSPEATASATPTRSADSDPVAIALRAQNDQMRADNERLLQTVYWGFAGVLTIGAVLFAATWISNSKYYDLRADLLGSRITETAMDAALRLDNTRADIVTLVGERDNNLKLAIESLRSELSGTIASTSKIVGDTVNLLVSIEDSHSKRFDRIELRNQIDLVVGRLSNRPEDLVTALVPLLMDTMNTDSYTLLDYLLTLIHDNLMRSKAVYTYPVRTLENVIPKINEKYTDMGNAVSIALTYFDSEGTRKHGYEPTSEA